jgi:hypothetical protein
VDGTAPPGSPSAPTRSQIGGQVRRRGRRSVVALGEVRSTRAAVVLINPAKAAAMLAWSAAAPK